MSLYTWNARTGFLDKLAVNTGLEFVGWVLVPGEWVKTEVHDLWESYVHLVEVKEENAGLRDRLGRMTLELAKYREEAAEVRRLRELLSFAPPLGWEAMGARVASQRMGPNSVLETIIVDQGLSSGVSANTPAITHQGVAGRVLRSSFHTSTVLLATDPNSRIPVVGQTHRTTGILAGMGADSPCRMLYVPHNDPVEEGEILVTSGMADIFPKGLPVARVTHVVSDTSLFQTVEAVLLVDPRNLEEVLLLRRSPRILFFLPQGNATRTMDSGLGGTDVSGNATLGAQSP